MDFHVAQTTNSVICVSWKRGWRLEFLPQSNRIFFLYIYIYLYICTCIVVQLGRTKSVQRICDPYTLKTDLEEGQEVIH